MSRPTKCWPSSIRRMNLTRFALRMPPLSAAKARLEQDSNHFDRQQTLLQQGWTTRANFDQAQQALRTAQAAVDDAKAQVEIAEDRVGYTELRAGVNGTITSRSAESGEVVQPGQMIFMIARNSGWDAVFDVPRPGLAHRSGRRRRSRRADRRPNSRRQGTGCGKSIPKPTPLPEPSGCA